MKKIGNEDINTIDALSREEASMYMNFCTQTVEQISNNLIESYEKLNDILTKKLSSIDTKIDVLNSGVNELTSSLTVLINALNNNTESKKDGAKRLVDVQAITNTKIGYAIKLLETIRLGNVSMVKMEFINTLSEKECSNWENEVFMKTMKKIFGSNTNVYEACKILYKELSDNNINVHSYFEEYKKIKPDTTNIKDMIVHSDYFRKETDAILSKLCKHKETADQLLDVKSEDYSNLPVSVQFNSTPPIIKKYFEVYAKAKNCSYIRARKNLYKRITSESGVDLDKAKNGYAMKNGYSHITKAYYISITKYLFDILDRIVREAI